MTLWKVSATYEYDEYNEGKTTNKSGKIEGFVVAFDIDLAVRHFVGQYNIKIASGVQSLNIKLVSEDEDVVY